jgi:hypothetical protein
VFVISIVGESQKNVKKVKNISSSKVISSAHLPIVTASKDDILIQAPCYTSQDVALYESLNWTYGSPPTKLKKVSKKSIVIPTKENSLAPVKNSKFGNQFVCSVRLSGWSDN